MGCFRLVPIHTFNFYFHFKMCKRLFSSFPSVFFYQYVPLLFQFSFNCLFVKLRLNGFLCLVELRQAMFMLQRNFAIWEQAKRLKDPSRVIIQTITFNSKTIIKFKSLSFPFFVTNRTCYFLILSKWLV